MKKRKVNEPTPAGGDYSEMIYLDDKGENVDEKFASRGIIRECKADGTVIQETFIQLTE